MTVGQLEVEDRTYPKCEPNGDLKSESGLNLHLGFQNSVNG